MDKSHSTIKIKLPVWRKGSHRVKAIMQTVNLRLHIHLVVFVRVVKIMLFYLFYEFLSIKLKTGKS